MTRFTKSFTWRFIVDVLLIGFLAGIALKLLLALLANAMGGNTSTMFLIIEAVIASVVNMLVVFFIAYWNIGVISKKGCYDYPQDSDKWFRNFGIIIIGLNLLSSVIGYIQGKSRISEQLKKLDSYNSEFFAETVNQAKEQINSLHTTFIIMPIPFPHHSRSIRMRAFDRRNEQPLKQILTKASAVETEAKFVKIQLQINTLGQKVMLMCY